VRTRRRPLGISRRQYARRRGCAESAVRKAIATGRIALEADGTIDPERADAQWAATSEPARVGHMSKASVTFVQARTATEVLRSQERRLKLQQMKGELVDRARAEALVFQLARQERDAWVNWPARAAALIAAELGIDPAATQKVLEAHVRAHLEELAEVRLDLS